MMPETILQNFVREAKGQFEQLEQELRQTLEFAIFEQALTEMLNDLSARLIEEVLNELLTDRSLLAGLKRWGGKLAMRFKEYRSVSLRLASGQTISVSAPYFTKARPKKRRQKRGPNGSGAYLGLDALGFIGRSSAQFVSEVVKLAVLSPSFEVAKEMLAGRGISIDVKTVRRLCQQLGAVGLECRGQISLEGTENLAGYTLVVGIDGGRLRERRRKRGRKKKGQKRQGYHTDWKEPKLFTLYLLDAQGQVVKAFAPLHDATMGNYEAMFALLAQYSTALDLSEVRRIVFCGDGAPWIWAGVEKLCVKMGLERGCPIYQVLDYTHAKQNLQEIIDLLPLTGRKLAKLARKWKLMLWQGDIQGLHKQICQQLCGEKREQALKKWHDYFERNEQRMQYETFRALHLPCGSGCVESAIRRVINLRLKAAGTFWTQEMAEYFLFLRSQLLSGRWHIFLSNVTRQKAHLVHNLGVS
jgi:hypothetical protein